MRTFGAEAGTYLYLNGLGTDKTVHLSEHVELLPARADCSADLFLGLGKTDIDISVISLFLPQVTSQLKVNGKDAKDTAIRAWNAVWDGLLLGALVGAEVMCNIQSEVPAEQLTPESTTAVTNYHLRGLSRGTAVTLTEADISWIQDNYEKARCLLDNESFQNATHCLASYRWHSMPRARLAILWSGIEGLFGVDSEIVFRVSLYAARFLEPHDNARQREVFGLVKELYKLRSKAVHGGRMKGNANEGVDESALLLRTLIRRCAELGSMPNLERLVP